MFVDDRDQAAPSLQRPSSRGTPLWSDRPEFPLYTALKYYLCRQLAAGGRTGPMRFTARRVLNMLSGPGPDRQPLDRLFTDLYPISSHAIRERLKALNSGTILQSTGRGLRKAVTYTWKEAVPSGVLRSCREIERRVGAEINLGFDAYRLAEAFSVRPFRVRDYLRHFMARREIFARQKRSRQSSRVNQAFLRFLMHRIEHLEAKGLVARAGPQMYCLTVAGEELAHWFELFAYSVELEPAQPGSPPA